MANDDRRTPMSIGMGLAARLSTLGLEFGLPVFLGHYLDLKLGSSPVGLLVGMVLGFTIGMIHIFRFARNSSKSD